LTKVFSLGAVFEPHLTKVNAD